MSYNKTTGAFHSVNIRINQPAKVMFITVLGLTNPDVNLKRIHQLYNVNLIYSHCHIRLNISSENNAKLQQFSNMYVSKMFPFNCIRLGSKIDLDLLTPS